MNSTERLENILQHDIAQAIEDGFNGHDIRRDEILSDVIWLIEQAMKTERYEKALLEIVEKVKSPHAKISEEDMKKAKEILI